MCLLRFFVPVALLGCLLVVPAAPPARPTPQDRALLARVSADLLVVTEPVADGGWPPRFIFADKGTHAVAVLRREGSRKQLVIRVPPALMGRFDKYREDALALLLAQALGHSLHKHALPDAKQARPRFTAAEMARADRTGAELLLRAGYSLSGARRGLDRLNEWQERLAKLDGEQDPLGRSTAAFRAGVVFLVTEQYALAEICFERVVNEFVGCPDAWIGLGYARLMIYLNRWTLEELRAHDTGMVPGRTFRKRGKGQRLMVRGKKSQQWWDAIDALGEGLRQKPDHIAGRVALGLAYLFHPDGKDTDTATEMLEKALTVAGKQKAAAAVRAEILLHLAVVRFAAGQVKKGIETLDRAAKLARGGSPSLAAAVLYNRALLAGSARDRPSKEKAVQMSESFLKTSDPLFLWWELAYERYVRLCNGLGRKGLARQSLVGKPRVRPAACVRLARGLTVAAGDEVDALAKKVGRWRKVTVLRGMNLVRLKLDKHALELLATDRLLAVCLSGTASPPVRLGKAGALRVGIAVADLDRLLGREYRTWKLSEARQEWRFYAEYGIAVRLSMGKLVEVVLVRIPSR